MDLEDLIMPYWFIFAVFVGRAIYIRKTQIIPTLKKYGYDYQDYMSIKQQNIQLKKYIELCEKHNLPDKYWKYMYFFNKAGLVLVIGWVILVFSIEYL